MKAVRLRRNPWMTGLSSIPWALIPVLAVASVVTGVPLVALAPHLLIIGALLFYRTWRTKPRAIREAADVTVTDTELRVGTTTIPREAIKKAEIVPHADPIVRVVKRGIDEDIIVKD